MPKILKLCSITMITCTCSLLGVQQGIQTGKSIKERISLFEKKSQETVLEKQRPERPKIKPEVKKPEIKTRTKVAPPITKIEPGKKVMPKAPLRKAPEVPQKVTKIQEPERKIISSEFGPKPANMPRLGVISSRKQAKPIAQRKPRTRIKPDFSTIPDQTIKPTTQTTKVLPKQPLTHQVLPKSPTQTVPFATTQRIQKNITKKPVTITEIKKMPEPPVVPKRKPVIKKSPLQELGPKPAEREKLDYLSKPKRKELRKRPTKKLDFSALQ